METMKHAFHSAESALHKDPKSTSGQEPMSGVRGQGTATDPYDAGNVSNPNLNSNKYGQEPLRGSKQTGTTSGRYDTDDTYDPVTSSTRGTGREPASGFGGVEGTSDKYGTGDAYKGSGQAHTAGATTGQYGARDTYDSKLPKGTGQEPSYGARGVGAPADQYDTSDTYDPKLGKGIGREPLSGTTGAGTTGQYGSTRDTYDSKMSKGLGQYDTSDAYDSKLNRGAGREALSGTTGAGTTGQYGAGARDTYDSKMPKGTGQYDTSDTYDSKLGRGTGREPIFGTTGAGTTGQYGTHDSYGSKPRKSSTMDHEDTSGTYDSKLSGETGYGATSGVGGAQYDSGNAATRGLNQQSDQVPSYTTDTTDAGRRTSHTLPIVGETNTTTMARDTTDSSKGAAPSTGATHHGGKGIGKPSTLTSSHSTSRPTQRGQDLQSDLGPSTETAPPRRGSKGDYASQDYNRGVQEQIGNPVLRKSAAEDSQGVYGNRGSTGGGGVTGAPALRTTNDARGSQYNPQTSEPQKSSGFASEGGDFDVTQPGAGREADRLLDERGDETGRRASKTGTGGDKDDGGLWTGNHKSGLSFSKAKEKLGMGKHS